MLRKIENVIKMTQSLGDSVMLSGKLKCTVIDGTDDFTNFRGQQNYYFLYIIIMWPSGPISHELEHKIAVAVANVVADKIKGWVHKK